MARHSVFHPLTVAEVEPLTEDAVALTFAVPEELAEDYAFTQGQHVTIRAEVDGEEVRRNYSICAPVSSRRLRVGIRRLEGGSFSAYAVDSLKPGDVLDVMTPSGRFFTPLDPRQARHYVCVAAGSGITPLLSIVATALEVEPASRVTLLYANRTHTSVMFLDDVADLKDRYPERFRVLHVLSREEREVELLSGRLDAARFGRILDTLVPPGDVDEWFLCGPLAMVETLRGVLQDRGVDPGHVHAELFHADAPSLERRPRRTPGVATEAGAEVTITLDGRTSVLTLAPDGPPVLDAALAVRSDAPYACRGGVCGTCRAKVLEGSVEMDSNWALEPDEVERGYVLTCQSHPTSQRVVLDYDA